MRLIGALLPALLLLTACRSPREPAVSETPARPASEAPDPSGELAGLREGALTHGFRTAALYLDAREQPMGGRFVHEHSGFVLDFLLMPTAPQGFVWVNTLAENDQGLPHAQEHLLLGKGNKGRHAAGVQSMSLVSSSAFTSNEYTAYHSRTTAGVDVYLDVLAVQLDALLAPDYTDEEIRREFCHHGVSGDPGALRLEEKGTVYVEMVSSYNKPGSRSWLARQATLHGAEHPKAKSSGGIPAAIRTVEPAAIRDFHREHYRLGNMGMILVLPPERSLGETLDGMDALLRRLQPERSTRPPDDVLPPPQPAPEGLVVVTEQPSADPNETVDVAFAWPPRLELDGTELLLLEQFLSTLAGDVSTNLYARFIDARTRRIDVDASSTWAWVEDEDGSAITIGLSGLLPSALTPAFLEDLRGQVRDELARIAAWEADDPALRDFDERLLTALIASERTAKDLLNQPPGFGSRGLRGNWYGHLKRLARTEGFRRSLALAPEHARAREILESPGNPWTSRLKDWGLLGTVPYTFAEKPSPRLQEEIETSRKARLEAETARLQREQGAESPQAALAAFAAEYDEASRALESLEEAELPPFLDDPPMSLDELLDFSEGKLAGSGIPVVASRFPGMTGASFGLALSLEAVPDEDLVYLSLLPALMSEVGVIDGDSPVSAAEVVQRMRREIQEASLETIAEPRAGRHELVAHARGVTPAEASRALEWTGLLLAHADWRPENLPRIRDVVDQALEHLRNRMRGREEYWVRDPMGAYTWQSDPLYLATSSFLTARNDALRLRWLLRRAEAPAAPAFIRRLAHEGAGAEREELAALAAAVQGHGPAPPGREGLVTALDGLDEDSRGLVEEAARDLEAELPALPDASLAADWRYLGLRMAADLERPPEEALARLGNLRDSLLRAGLARTWEVGAGESLSFIEEPIARLVSLLRPGRPAPVTRDERPLMWTRLEQRGADVSRRSFAALVEPSLTGGVVQHRAPLTLYEDTSEEKILDVLAAASYGGSGPHSLFMKTWGAGLAYSNGLSASPSRGQISYYAERCPSTGETLSFVAGVLKEAEPDPSLSDYAVAQLFSSRAAGSYDQRGEAMAADLADGRPPATIRAFREALLAAREREDLAAQLHARLAPIAGRVLPGLGPRLSDVPGGHFFAIGTEAQVAAHEDWLREQEGPEVRVHRLYPRDFWRVAIPPEGPASPVAAAN